MSIIFVNHIINNAGTNTLETLPNPSSRSLCEINQMITQPISIATAMTGMNWSKPDMDSEECKRVVAKNVSGFAPQPLVKLKNM